MTQEEKELLLKDLCARLPYSVQVEIEDCRGGVLKGIDGNTVSTDRGINYPLRLVKPYLRPMSSMTDEEKKAFDFFKSGDRMNYVLFDWLDKKMFDYRGLIPMGLALEAPVEMYNIK